MMINLKPFSRLTIIFILAVTIPGGILSYLSIQNITNLRELTERKVIEDEEALADLIYKNFEQKLNSILEDFTSTISNPEDRNFNSVRFIDSCEFIDDPYVIDINGKYIWPVYSEGQFTLNTISSSNYRSNLHSGEQYEFKYNDYSKAGVLYLKALADALTKNDSAAAMNALARLYVKAGDNEGALSYYSMLIKQFSGIEDKNGIPYLSYAIPQLLDITDSSNAYTILKNLNFSLQGLKDGSIPLHNSTGIYINEALLWIKRSKFFKADELRDTENSLEEIKGRLAFLDTDGTVIRAFIHRENMEKTIKLAVNTYAISGPSGNAEKPLIINFSRDSALISGFKIDLKKMAEHSIKLLIPQGIRFEYEIELIKDDINAAQYGHSLISTSMISPLCPNTTLLIRLKNENMVEERVTRASWIYGVSIILLLGGMILGVFLIIKDFHRERKLSKLRSEFVSNVSHELKTPLTSIYMFAESILLGRVKSGSEQKEYLGIILKETERLKRLINNILDFSKKEKGKLEYNFTEVNISEVVNYAINNLEYWIIEKEFTINTKIEDNIIGLADADALKQAIINLLSNSINYSHERKKININLWKVENRVHIEVEDKGVGIAENEIDHIFDKFYRIETEKRTEYSGTGLGLTMVKEIVEAHGGKILVESVIDQGSKFTIILNSES